MTWSSAAGSLDLATLREAYERGEATPSAVVHAVYERIASHNDPATWISLVEPSQALERARELEARAKDLPLLPLYGIPFSVKDSIDVAGLPTTAACPAYSFNPAQSAEVVKHLLEAGAILIGKNNLDQFATGLVGVRSPYGTPRNPFDSHYIPGGSSSGSAVAVAAGLVSFSVGTDTAGSGRVPAAFNNVVGYKPTRGLLSVNGIVPGVPFARLRVGFRADVPGCCRCGTVRGRSFGSKATSPRSIAQFVPIWRSGKVRSEDFRRLGDRPAV